MRALVVDDEEPARRRLIRLLEALGGVEIAGQAADGDAAARAIETLKPDVVLLDIGMPKLDGLSLAARSLHLPPIVFVTAHQEFAVRAFEVNAADYLLKPVSPSRLATALERVRARRTAGHSAPNEQQALAAVSPQSTRICVGSRGTVRFLEAATICRFWAADKYTLFVAEGSEEMTEEPLSSLEERLAPLGFVRVHRAELIQLSKVKELKTVDGVNEVTLSDGQVAKVSRRSLQAVKSALGLASRT
jgi:DNA-binding LytR/AlgR family response regulator